MSDIDIVAFYDKPLLKFERLLETYYRHAPKGFFSFLKAIPVWLKEKLFLKKIIKEALSEIEPEAKTKYTFLFPEHHLSHAASTYYPSAFEEAAILTIDGVGEWATTTIGFGTGKNIRVLKEIHFPNSLGLLYSAFTYYLGFKVNSGEYKVMGLAPYGRPNASEVAQFKEKILKHIIHLKDDGSFTLNPSYFKYATGLSMTNDKKWIALFGFSRRQADTKIEQIHCNLALALQQVIETAIFHLAREAKRITKSKNLCLAGGVALNCVANGKLLRQGIFENIFITPAAGDSGGALGAALASHYIFHENERKISLPDALKSSLLGPNFSKLDIEKTIRSFKASAEYLEDEQLFKVIAQQINKGKIIGWFQGRMEFGPRALGNRSILANPMLKESQRKVNLKIKYRESFRPFAPAVLAEDQAQFFDLKAASPYMLMTAPVTASIRLALPPDFETRIMEERLSIEKSELPAITHIDFSARVQSVTATSNPRFYQLLQAFKEISGKGVLLNTSFNVRGEPIVCKPEDAYRCFMNTEMDVLVIENFVFYKSHQNKTSWKH